MDDAGVVVVFESVLFEDSFVVSHLLSPNSLFSSVGLLSPPSLFVEECEDGLANKPATPKNVTRTTCGTDPSSFPPPAPVALFFGLALRLPAALPPLAAAACRRLLTLEGRGGMSNFILLLFFGFTLLLLPDVDAAVAVATEVEELMLFSGACTSLRKNANLF